DALTATGSAAAPPFPRGAGPPVCAAPAALRLHLLPPEGGQHPGEFRRGGTAGHPRPGAEHQGRLRVLQPPVRVHGGRRRGTVQARRATRRYSPALTSASRFSTRRLPAPPSLLRIDSGWNCTAHSGSSRCASAISSPSSLRAEASRQSGSSAATRLW